MTSPRKTSPPNDFNLHVSFQLVDDATYRKQKETVEALLEERFPGGFSVEHEDLEGLPEREVVYRLQKPVLVQPEAMEDFFQKLQELFELTHRHLPAFTQSSETPQ